MISIYSISGIQAYILDGILTIFIMDHTHIKPFDACHFLTSSQVIPCFRMVSLKTSVHAYGDFASQQDQKIPCYNH